MTTTMTPMQTLKRALRTDPHARWYLGHAFAFRQASMWSTPDAVQQFTKESFRIVMRSSARMAIHSAKIAVDQQRAIAGLNGGAL